MSLHDLQSLMWLVRTGGLGHMAGEEAADEPAKSYSLVDMKGEDITNIVYRDSRSTAAQPAHSPLRLLREREMNAQGSFRAAHKAQMLHRFFPHRKAGTLGRHRSQVFCGQFSKDGSVFLSACQDQRLRFYDVHNNFKHVKTIGARDVGWSVLDTHYSPDQRYAIYSSWSPYVQMVNVHGSTHTHVALDFEPISEHFAAFSIKFSPNGREIVAGTCDNGIYLFDVTRNERLLRIDAHESDVNSVTFADDTPNVIFSGSDDHTIKVWDRRMFGSGVRAQGVLQGHTFGITYIDSKGDGRYLLSNGKDQCAKLWDIRRMLSSQDPRSAYHHPTGHWDYRVHHRASPMRHDHPHDCSLMTYIGHTVLKTLIRCHFSPADSTGQRYVYSGSNDGRVYVYDLVSGEIVRTMHGHGHALVRDASWHPHLPIMITSGWDGRVVRWGTDGSTHAPPAPTRCPHAHGEGGAPARRSARVASRAELARAAYELAMAGSESESEEEDSSEDGEYGEYVDEDDLVFVPDDDDGDGSEDGSDEEFEL